MRAQVGVFILECPTSHMKVLEVSEAQAGKCSSFGRSW
jgi:hypothetical protein